MNHFSWFCHIPIVTMDSGLNCSKSGFSSGKGEGSDRSSLLVGEDEGGDVCRAQSPGRGDSRHSVNINCFLVSNFVFGGWTFTVCQMGGDTVVAFEYGDLNVVRW